MRLAQGEKMIFKSNKNDVLMSSRNFSQTMEKGKQTEGGEGGGVGGGGVGVGVCCSTSDLACLRWRSDV